jgi:deoxyribose-phosphate aldolase
MDTRRILSAVDHTLLTQTATWEEIRRLCEEGMRYRTASVCIPPCYVRQAGVYVQGRIPVCTVVGFPNGYAETAVKVYETQKAVEEGADEIDMVVNLGLVRAGRFADAQEEIHSVRRACRGKVLKVIVETCLLTDSEKLRMCGVVADAGADYIKTSTGFSAGGATAGDIRLFARAIAARPGPAIKIKAAGGIRNLETAEEFLRLGASRLGSSSLLKMVKAAAPGADDML